MANLDTLTDTERSALTDLAEALCASGVDVARCTITDAGGGQADPQTYCGRLDLAAVLIG